MTWFGQTQKCITQYIYIQYFIILFIKYKKRKCCLNRAVTFTVSHLIHKDYSTVDYPLLRQSQSDSNPPGLLKCET